MNKLPKIDNEQTKKNIIRFIKEKVSKANAEGVVVGISGGIDSSLTACLSCEAIGKENVFGVMMPSTTTPTEDKLHGADLVKILEIDYKEVPIDSILNEFISVSENINDKKAIGNLKARIRMSILYYYANLKNYIVCGTGNKSEILIGYFTKFGDGACDMEPIGDLYKTEVKQIAKEVNVPNEIIEKSPRAGLWNNQTDEDEIGMSYDTLDKLLYMLIDKNMNVEKIANNLKIPIEEVNRIAKKVANNQHKNEVPEISNKVF